jgi:hypothetical protein
MLYRLSVAVFTAVILTLPTAAFAAAARVEFIVGKAVALDLQGKERVLVRGAEVGEGDTVDTGNARVQLRFSDGAYVSLQPQSKFRIDQYRFNGKTDGSERGFFSLLQGGLRTITGLVGRTNKKNYQVNTAVATIGIRGTEYTVSYGSSLAGSVGEGEIVVCNAGGCTNVTSGESYFVPTAELKPVITGKKVDLPPPQPQTAPPAFTAGDTTNSTGTPTGLQLSGTQQLTLANSVAISCRSACGGFGVIPSDVITFADNGAVASVNSGNDPLTDVVEFGNNGLLAWGRGLDRFGQYFHYVTGIGTASSELSQLAISNPVATYSVIGATSPVAGSGAQQVVGQFQAATLTAHFNAAQVDASVQFAIAGSTVVATAAGMPISTAGVMTFGSGGQTAIASCVGGGCTASSVSMGGFLAGPGGANAGLVYQLANLTDAGGKALPGPVAGAVAFAQNR